jgi:hypothetical protein
LYRYIIIDNNGINIILPDKYISAVNIPAKNNGIKILINEIKNALSDFINNKLPLIDLIIIYIGNIAPNIPNNVIIFVIPTSPFKEE